MFSLADKRLALKDRSGLVKDRSGSVTSVLRTELTGLTKSRPHDRATAQRPHSLGDRAAQLHALGTCLISNYDRTPMINSY